MAWEESGKKNKASDERRDITRFELFDAEELEQRVKDRERFAKKECREWILMGDPDRFLLALWNHGWEAMMAMIADLEASKDPQWAEISPRLESAFASRLREQSSALEERAPAELREREQAAFSALKVAHALVLITKHPQVKSDVLVIVLNVWRALEYGWYREVLFLLPFFDPDEVMTKLIPIMQAVCGLGGSGVFCKNIDSLISGWPGSLHWFADERERAFSLYATFFAKLLSVGQLDGAKLRKHVDEVKKHILAKLEAWAGTLSGGLDLIVEELTKAGVTRSRLYASVLGYSERRENRIRAVEYLGEHGATSTLQPLPPAVLEVRLALNAAAETDDDEVRQAAKKALTRNIERGREQAATETRINICAMALEFPRVFPPVLSNECFFDPADHPRLPIHPHLTVLPGVRESFHVNMDGPQEVSRGPAAAPPPDIDLSSLQFATNTGDDGFAAHSADRVDLATASFTSKDPAVQRTRILLRGGSGEHVGPAKAEQEWFRERYQALGKLVESGEVNAAALDGPLAALNKAYRELSRAQSERVIGVPEAAEILGLTGSRVHQLAREGLIGQKIARRFLFTREELEREKQRPRSKGGRPPTDNSRDVETISFTTIDPAVQHTHLTLISEAGGNLGPAKAEQEWFRDRCQALGTLVESGEINAAALDGPLAALNEAYRELARGGGTSGGGEFPFPRGREGETRWAGRLFEPGALPTTGTGSERVLVVSEAAEILGLTPGRVHQLAREGLIGQKIAGRFLFTRKELEREKQRPRSKGGRPPTSLNED